MKFDPQEGYIAGLRHESMPYIDVFDTASNSMTSMRLNEAYDAGVQVAELNVTPVTKEFLMAIKDSVNSAKWDADCERVVMTQLGSVSYSHLIAAVQAPDPFVFIASYAYQANKYAPKASESAKYFREYLARVVTVYLQSNGYYMPNTIYPLLIQAIASASATRIDKIIKGMHIQIGIKTLEKYLNEKEQLSDGVPAVTVRKRIRATDAKRYAEALD
ncbi:hypothetical protein [Idiomarina aquatica]|nr:hypothetical protein [Idiomarina aquatica]